MKKTKQFLSQIPNWEEKYKKTDDKEIDFKKSDWLNASAKFTKHDLKIFGCAVMEDWEKPYMKDLAKVACSNGGTILELGFGMAISAKFIQKEKISKHIIIEANKEVANEARKFAKKAKHETLILEGFWEDMIKKIPDNSLDGILFDTYPLSDKELYQNHFFFFPFAYKKLKKGGIFTYYSDEINTFGKVHLQKLQKAGFKKENINSRVCKIVTPRDCEYWKDDTMLTPIIKK